MTCTNQIDRLIRASVSKEHVSLTDEQSATLRKVCKFLKAILQTNINEKSFEQAVLSFYSHKTTPRQSGGAPIAAAFHAAVALVASFVLTYASQDTYQGNLGPVGQTYADYIHENLQQTCKSTDTTPLGKYSAAYFAEKIVPNAETCPRNASARSFSEVCDVDFNFADIYKSQDFDLVNDALEQTVETLSTEQPPNNNTFLLGVLAGTTAISYFAIHNASKKETSPPKDEPLAGEKSNKASPVFPNFDSDSETDNVAVEEHPPQRSSPLSSKQKKSMRTRIIAELRVIRDNIRRMVGRLGQNAQAIRTYTPKLKVPNVSSLFRNLTRKRESTKEKKSVLARMRTMFTKKRTNKPTAKEPTPSPPKNPTPSPPKEPTPSPPKEPTPPPARQSPPKEDNVVVRPQKPKRPQKPPRISPPQNDVELNEDEPLARDSVPSSSTAKKKTRKFCATCNIEFTSQRELADHFKTTQHLKNKQEEDQRKKAKKAASATRKRKQSK